jgi:lipoprotein-releasing system permease protein
MSLAGDRLSRLALQEQEFTLTGTVRTGYLEYDKTLGFISLESAREIMGENYIVYGIKTDRIGREDHFLVPISSLLSSYKEARLTTWRDYNKAFFEALRMEKVLMFLVVSLVFLVVAVNIYQSLKRSVSERMEEIALFKSIGAVPSQIKMIFLQEGLFLSFTGVFTGMVLGILLSLNINDVFSLVELVGNAFLGLFHGSGFSIYSSGTFYLVNVPVLIMTPDLIFIGITAVFLSLAGAWAAASPVAGINPAEVLNIE